MPALQKNLLFHGENWNEHLEKYHTPEEIQQYRREVKAF